MSNVFKESNGGYGVVVGWAVPRRVDDAARPCGCRPRGLVVLTPSPTAQSTVNQEGGAPQPSFLKKKGLLGAAGAKGLG